MSRDLTRIYLPNSPAGGIKAWGRNNAQHMIQKYREHGEELRAESDAILNSPDEDFQIDIVRGAIAERHVQELQKSALKYNKGEL